MKIFALKTPAGVIVVTAESAEKALQVMREKEDRDEVGGIACGKTPADLEEFSTEEAGIVAYYVC